MQEEQSVCANVINTWIFLCFSSWLYSMKSGISHAVCINVFCFMSRMLYSHDISVQVQLFADMSYWVAHIWLSTIHCKPTAYCYTRTVHFLTSFDKVKKSQIQLNVDRNVVTYMQMMRVWLKWEVIHPSYAFLPGSIAFFTVDIPQLWTINRHTECCESLECCIHWVEAEKNTNKWG